MDPVQEDALTSTRRTFLQRGIGLGAIALGAMDGVAASAQEGGGAAQGASPWRPAPPLGAGEAGAVPVHGRRAAPARHLDFKPKLRS